MKFLLISGVYPPDIGGPAVFVPKLTEFLLNNGHECEVLTLRDHYSQKPIQKWRVRYVSRTFLPIRMMRTIAVLCDMRQNVSVYFANGLIEEVGLFLFLTRKNGVAKIVGDAVWERARNKGKTLESVTEFNSHTGDILQRIQRAILVFSLNRFRLVICPSDELKSIVLSWGVKTPIYVIQNGVQLPNIAENQIKDIDVVAVSRLVTWKNIDVVILACQQIGATLWIVGDGPERKRLEEIASKQTSKIVFTGNLDNSEVPNILKRAKIFALYSDYEGLSFALLEAMAHSVVPVVSECKGNMAIITDGENGMTVPLQNPEALKSSIKTLLLDEKKREHLGIASRRLVQERYSIEERLDEYLRIFRELT